MKNIILTLITILSLSAYGQSFNNKDFNFRITGKGTVSISARDMGMSGNVAIPASITMGDTTYTVTAISENGFANCTGIRSIILPAKISKIGRNAFLNCTNLNSVNIPYAVKEIKDGTFCHCKSLSGITVPDGVTSIGNYAFAHCENINRFNVPDNCKSIGDKAFYNCKNLQVIAFTAKVEHIGIRAMQGCISLRRLAVEPENTQYACVDDVMFTKDLSRLIKYPALKEGGAYNMPSSVKFIDEYAFENVKELMAVKIAPGCTRICNMAFVNCENLQKAPYPPSLREVGMDSFFGCIRFNEESMPGGINFIEYDYNLGMIEELE